MFWHRAYPRTPILLVICWATDWLSKSYVVAHLSYGDRLEITSWLNGIVSYNRGVSFGLFRLQGAWGGYFWGAITIGLITFIAFLYRTSKARYERLGYVFMMGGALGNLTDRFTRPGVLDFIDVHWGAWHWPAFNFADSYVVLGVGLILIEQACNRLRESSYSE